MKITAQWGYDGAKRMAYRHYSLCCGADVAQKRMLHGKVDINPLVTSKTTVAKKTKVMYKKFLWVFRRKETVEYTEKSTSPAPPYTYRYFCTSCDKQTKGSFQFKHNVGVSEGRRLVSKTYRVGSIPTTPAKRKVIK